MLRLSKNIAFFCFFFSGTAFAQEEWPPPATTGSSLPDSPPAESKPAEPQKEEAAVAPEEKATPVTAAEPQAEAAPVAAGGAAAGGAAAGGAAASTSSAVVPPSESSSSSQDTSKKSDKQLEGQEDLEGACADLAYGDSGNFVRTPIEQWDWGLGLRSLFSFSSTRSELWDDPGNYETNELFLARFTPTVYVNIARQFQLSFGIGPLFSTYQRDQESISTRTEWVFELTASYIIPLSRRVAFIPGIGIGAYFGSSDRPYVVNGVVTQEKTSTSGMLVDLLLPLSYQFSENIQMRTGITIQSVFGWEEIDSQQRSLQFQNYYIGFPFDFYYTF